MPAGLTDERDALRGRHALCHQQLEDGEGQQHRHPQRHLLAGVGRQVEAEGCQEGDHDAGQEQVEDVEGRAAAEEQGVGDVGVGLGAAAVGDDVPGGRHAQHLPLHVLHEVRQVPGVQPVAEVDLVPVVGPGAEGEAALLPVEGEVGDVHLAGALGDGRRVPHDVPVGAQHHVGLH